MEKINVISLGGSIIIPDEIDVNFLKDFYRMIDGYLSQNAERKLILVCGGGFLARRYQKAFREVSSIIENNLDHSDNMDWIGIAATRLNGELVRHIFKKYCSDPVVYDPSADFNFSGRILIAAGWKPGFSTDYDAVVLGERFGADVVINLSNIAKVFTDDPKKNPDAVPIDQIDWPGFLKIVGDDWAPGKNVPFDPIAAKRASKNHIKVIMAAGNDLENLSKILHQKPFFGTIIGPD